jgi:hypothetical protein
MNKPKKYNGFWKWFFISELILILLINLYIILNGPYYHSYQNKTNYCAEAFNCVVDEKDSTKFICDYCNDNNCTNQIKITCPNRKP